jgi:serine protease
MKKNLSLCLALGLFSAALTVTGQVPSERHEDAIDTIIIKFAEGSKIRLSTSLLRPQFFSKLEDPDTVMKIKDTLLNKSGIEVNLLRVQDVFYQFGEVSIRKLFPKSDSYYEEEKTSLEAKIAADQEKAPGYSENSARNLPDMNLYYVLFIKYRPGLTRQAFLAQLDSNKLIQTAYPRYHAETPDYLSGGPLISHSSTPTPLFSNRQRYLNPAPTGINASFAWNLAGGKGENIHLIDIEQNWDTLHEDLNRPYVMQGDLLGNAYENPNHGTAVLGEISGLHNRIGINGISPAVQYGVVAVNDNFSVGNGILLAADLLQPGDVMLIEQHVKGPDVPGRTSICDDAQFEYVPMEYKSDCYDAIVLATAKGIIVVEAAGNGQMNLDDTIYQNVFDPSQHNSGAIMVAADGAGDGIPACFTNYGRRINFFAWGDGVISSGYGDLYNPGNHNRLYTATFGGTSSASPIVAGTIALIQAIRKRSGRPLWAAADFIHYIHGTPQTSNIVKAIGIQPDLKATLTSMR